jgi:hypothetical protein
MRVIWHIRQSLRAYIPLVQPVSSNPMIPNNTHLTIGSLLFDGLDQIDLTGPFEVLSRIPNSTYRLYSKTADAVRDLKGLRLTLDAILADAPQLDVLHVPGRLWKTKICSLGSGGRLLVRIAFFRCAPGL